MEAIPLSAAFPRDPALDPLRQLAGDLTLGILPAYFFYWKRGRWWGSDGLNHAAINPALLSHFEGLFTRANARHGRGALFALWSEDAAPRQAIFVDTLQLQAVSLGYLAATSRTLEANYPREPRPGPPA